MDFLKTWGSSLLNFLTHRTFPALIVLVIGIFVITIVMKLLKTALAKSKLEKAAHSLIKSVVRIVLYVVLALIVASKLGLDVTSVVALASVLTLAVSLALQNALANLIGGFTLLYTDPFDSGDFVEIAGQSGTVKEIGLTYTKLATADNKIVSIPNSAVVATEIINYTTAGTRRVQVTVCASYDSPVETVLEALLDAAKVSTALEDPAPSSALLSYKDSAIEYTLFVWCKSADYWSTLFTVNKNIRAVFAQKDIIMTYPHLNVHLDK